MIDRIDQSVDIHDRSQIEIRLDYDQNLDDPKNCYKVDTYLFFPRSLRVDKHHYDKDSFYQDLKTNIRLKTPQVAINKLVDSDNPRSLRKRIKPSFDRILSGIGTAEDEKNIIHELKVFGSIFRGQVSDQVDNLLQLIDQISDTEKFTTLCNDLSKLIKITIKDVTNAINIFRKLRSKFIHPTIPAKLNLVAEEINEFLSLVVDTQMSRLALAVEAGDLAETIGSAYSKLLDLLDQESSYRRGAGYLSGDPHAHEGEKYIYRKGELKKSIMEVLFLRPKLQKEGKKTSQLIAMLAAGAAMSWAVIALVAGNSTFVENSTPFICLMVFSYIVKDRIKDTLKKILSEKIMAKYFFDRKMEFYEPNGKQLVGYIRERFGYIDKDSLPQDIRDARYPVNSGKRFETIIKHTRQVILFSKAFNSSSSSVANLTRLSVGNFTSKMDDAETLLPCFDEGTAKLLTMSKVYHLHLILKISPCCKGGNPSIKHYRLVLNKDGIKRLEVLNAQSEITTVMPYPTPLPHEVMVEPEDISQELEVPLAHTKVRNQEDILIE